jgi:ribokinase
VPPPGPPRDSYGAGDSFAAGFTFGLASGGSVADAAAIGARCGAEAMATVGPP